MAAAETTNTRRRVKLYMLNENRAWDDNGTGHVSVTYSEKPKFMMLDVKSEIDGELAFKISSLFFVVGLLHLKGFVK